MCSSDLWFQEELAHLGYPTPQTGELDVATRHVIAAFQMRFRPTLFDGAPDAETAAILRALNCGEQTCLRQGTEAPQKPSSYNGNAM